MGEEKRSLFGRAKDKIEEAQKVVTESPYDISVNRGSMSQDWFRRHAAGWWAKGYALHTVFEQAGNTVMVWQRRTSDSVPGA